MQSNFLSNFEDLEFDLFGNFGDFNNICDTTAEFKLSPPASPGSPSENWLSFSAIKQEPECIAPTEINYFVADMSRVSSTNSLVSLASLANGPPVPQPPSSFYRSEPQEIKFEEPTFPLRPKAAKQLPQYQQQQQQQQEIQQEIQQQQQQQHQEIQQQQEPTEPTLATTIPRNSSTNSLVQMSSQNQSSFQVPFSCAVNVTIRLPQPPKEPTESAELDAEDNSTMPPSSSATTTRNPRFKSSRGVPPPTDARTCSICQTPKRRIYRYLGASVHLCNACNQHWRRNKHNDCVLCTRLEEAGAAAEMRGNDIEPGKISRERKHTIVPGTEPY